mmetsp:Transcript_9136/g.23447  ORF Transcript_9136/g.23447 Transcript_9136/m.23447 type:complete len:91 (+) Transcript_9136:218-490(+)
MNTRTLSLLLLLIAAVNCCAAASTRSLQFTQIRTPWGNVAIGNLPDFYGQAITNLLPEDYMDYGVGGLLNTGIATSLRQGTTAIFGPYLG